MKDIYKILEDLGIKYVKHDHPALFTCEQAEEYYAKIPGAHTKNLFLRNKKGDKYYLVVVESKKRADINKLRGDLGESKLGFGSPERLLNVLGLTPGSVTPFGLINDEQKQVAKVLIDKDLLDFEVVNFHPLINTATLGISAENFKKFLGWTGHDWEETTIEA